MQRARGTVRDTIETFLEEDFRRGDREKRKENQRQKGVRVHHGENQRCRARV